MRLDWALLAKGAYAPPGALPSIMAAGMNSVMTPARETLPPEVAAALPPGAVAGPIPITLVMGLLSSRAETGRPQSIEITIIGADAGKERLQSKVELIGPMAPADLPAGVDIFMVAVAELILTPLAFEPHTVNIFLSGTLAKQLPLMVNRIPT